MARATPKVPFTYDDYKSLPFSETEQYELLGGEILMVPSPGFRHQRISWELEYRLSQHVRERGLGIVADAPLDVVLGEGDDREVAQPDVLFISQERAEIIHDDEVRGAPDLVLEILSPSTADYDRGYKRTLYARAGVREYWIVDPEAETVEVLQLGERGFATVGTFMSPDTLTSALLPGLAIPLDDVF